MGTKKMRKPSSSDLLQELANTDGVGISDFRKKYGDSYNHYKDGDLLKRRDELRLLWLAECGIREELMKLPENLEAPADDPRPLVWEDGTVFSVDTSKADWLIEDWFNSGSCEHGVSMQEFICRHWLQLESGKGWNVIWTSEERKIKPSPQSLSKILLMACISESMRFSYCRNPKCESPFFLAKRRDQLYCSADCSVHGQRAAKRRWWHENKGKLANKEDK